MENVISDCANKPAYRVPSMAEIAQVHKHGLTVVSTFSGCGGSCLGFEMDGYQVKYAAEFIPAAQKVYEDNHSGVFLDRRDIRKIQVADIFEAIGTDQVDVFEGSPPCASFSTAGKRQQHWGEVKKYCIDASTPVLMVDLTWQAAGNLREGDQVIGFDENTDGRHRKFKSATIEGTEKIIRPCVRISTSNGTEVTCSVEHRWLIQQGRNLRWKCAGDIKPGDMIASIGRPWQTDESRDGGYLAGIFDGEGCVSCQSDGATRILSFAQNEGPVLDTAVGILRKITDDFGIYDQGADCRTININGGPFGKARVLGIIRPHRLLSKSRLLWEGVSVSATEKTEVTAVEKLGEREVVALSTSAKTFIADGLLSHNSDSKQRTDDLFFEYARLLKGMQPRAFVAENVSGLVKGAAKGYFIEIIKLLKNCGYQVACRMLDAQWLGVPQKRQRVIFVGVRDDLAKRHGVGPAFPEPLKYRYSVRDACPWIVRQGANSGFGQEKFEQAVDPSGTIGASPNTGNGRCPPSEIEAEADISRFAIGEEWAKVAVGGKSDKYLNLVKADPDDACPTITQTGGVSSAAGVVHPTERRKFTIAELKRICGFPDDFKLSGTYSQQWERLGRAVPPVMMYHVARTLRQQVLEQCAST